MNITVRLHRTFVVFITFIFSASLFFSACTSNRTTSSWVNEEIKFEGLHRILVAAPLNDPNTRRRFEGEFAAELKDNGISAITSNSIHPDFLNHARETLLELGYKAGADTLLICNMKQVDRETIVAPSLDRAVTADFDGYDRTIPGFYEMNEAQTSVVLTKAILEINLFEVKSEDLVWTSTTTSVDLTSDKKIIRKLAQALVNQMKKDGIIK